MRRGAYTPDTSTAPPCDAQYELNLKNPSDIEKYPQEENILFRLCLLVKVEWHSAKLHWNTSLCFLRNWLAAETFSDPILKTMPPLELEADDPKLEDVPGGELVARRD